MKRLVLFFALLLFGLCPASADSVPTPVVFPSLDGKTVLTGYLYIPAGPDSMRHPAIVMMHGRAGAYSSKADGRYDATTLSQRHAFWGRFWADHGFVVLLVDGFGPRGYPHGFPAHSYDSRPDVLNEVTVRPLDAYGALRFLRTRPDVDGTRIGLQGWSNGGSATIATMADETLTGLHLTPADGFRAALAFYPACRLHGRFQTGYHPYAPLRVLSGDAGAEVSADHCRRLVEAAQKRSELTIDVYPGAEHDFDDPGRKRQSVAANAAARDHAVAATLKFMQEKLRR